MLHLTQYRLKFCRFKDQFSIPIQDSPLEFPQLEHLQIKSCNQPKLLNINEYQWINIFPRQLNYFYLKSIPNASIRLNKQFPVQYL
ncbi:unnamed protein product [Adineta steineri]|uniref:Uncharacterized protein n=1 Tax=Adineta steineri TaxID=433720 RepID=A0A813ZJW3_9BILA|nr:unnamed protein product [Adineta steineri]